MRRLVISGLLTMLALFTAMPVLATDANYDSNGVTAFYGEYEYPKDEPAKDTLTKKDETGSIATIEEPQRAVPETTAELTRALPAYQGEGTIIPATGDTSNTLPSLLGIALLTVVFFKLKGVENAEKDSII